MFTSEETDMKMVMGQNVNIKETEYLDDGIFVVLDDKGRDHLFDIQDIHEHIKKDKMH